MCPETLVVLALGPLARGSSAHRCQVLTVMGFLLPIWKYNPQFVAASGESAFVGGTYLSTSACFHQH